MIRDLAKMKADLLWRSSAIEALAFVNATMSSPMRGSYLVFGYLAIRIGSFYLENPRGANDA